MAKLSKKDMKETIREITNEILQEKGCYYCQYDEATVIDLDENVICSVEDFVQAFWEKLEDIIKYFN